MLKNSSTTCQVSIEIETSKVCGTGDSAMNKSFGDMVKIAAEANVAERLELVTNGLLLKPKLADV